MYDEVYGYQKIFVNSEFGLTFNHLDVKIPKLDDVGNPLTYIGKYSLYDEIDMNEILNSVPFDVSSPLSIPSSFTSSLSGRFIIKIIYTSSSSVVTHDEYLLTFKNERNNYNG